MNDLKILMSGGLEKIIDALDDAVFLEDLEGHIIYVNKKVEEIYGYTRDELTKGGVELIVPKEETKKLPSFVESLLKRRKIKFTSYNMDKSGRVFPVEICATLLEIDGRKYALIEVKDLTEREREKNILRAIGELSGEAIVVTDELGNIIWWNMMAEKIFGYTQPEALGRKFYDLIVPPDNKEEYLRRIKKLEIVKKTSNFHIYRATVKMMRKNGDIFFAEVTKTLVKVGKHYFAIAIIKDATRRVNYEKLMEEEREKYKNILDEMLNSIIIIQDEKIVFVNRAFEEMSGYHRNEIIGSSFLIFIDDLDKSRVLENYKRRILGLSAPKEYAIRIRKKNGDLRWVYTRPKVIEYERKKADLVSMIDITELKRREDMIHAIDEMSRKLRIVKNLDGMYSLVTEVLKNKIKFDQVEIFDVERCKECKSKTAKNVFKYHSPFYNPRVRMNGRVVSEYAVPVVVDGFLRNIILVRRGGEDSIEEYERKMVDMAGIHLSLAVKNWINENELRKSKELQELMLHIVAHDLKTPLAVISGYADFLSEEYREEYVEEIKKAVSLAVDIIDKAKLFSRLDMGKISEERKVISINKVIEDIKEIVKKKYPKANIEISGTRVRIKGYEALLREAFLNMIDNALKYGAKNVSVELSTEDDLVVIRIADDGPGIPDKYKDKIFDPLVKYHPGGSGLGLYIVRKIVDLHGGNVRIEDNEPKGSVFVIEIPKR